MENESKQIPIRFYEKFWTGDFANLPLFVQDHLGEFLERLVEDPERKELLAKCQKARKEPDYWAYFFCDEYVLYWHLVREEPGLYIVLSACKVIRIDVLEIRKRDEIPAE